MSDGFRRLLAKISVWPRTNFDAATCCFLPRPSPFSSLSCAEFISSRYLPPTNLPLVPTAMIYSRPFLRIATRNVLFIPFQFIPASRHPRIGAFRPEEARLLKIVASGADHTHLIALKAIRHPGRFPLFFASRKDPRPFVDIQSMFHSLPSYFGEKMVNG